MVPPPATAAPIVAAGSTSLRFDEGAATLPCLYVQVDARGRSDVSDFLQGWSRCCDLVTVDWQSVRRPRSVLVSLELRRCCDDSPASLRLVFDVNRDAGALQTLLETEALVVGNRPLGGFANSMVLYGVDANVLRKAIAAAERGLDTSAVAV